MHPELITIKDLLVVVELLVQVDSLSEMHYYNKRDEVIFIETPANDAIKIFTNGWVDISH